MHPARDQGARRDSLKLILDRSVSEPHGVPLSSSSSLAPLVLSPPSIQPSKRSRVTGLLTVPSSSPSISLPSSPFNESIGMQRTLMMQQIELLEAADLASRLMADKELILVDCRPFMAFNVSHVQGAINVNCCDRFNRKRLHQGKASLADLASSKEGKEKLRQRQWTNIVVYDDTTDTIDALSISHPLSLVLNALLDDNRRPMMLKGGFRAFQKSWPSLCADHLVDDTGKEMSAKSSSSSRPCIVSSKDLESHPASKVLPYLFLGNMRDASDPSVLKCLHIKYVLNVTAKKPEYTMDPELVYKQLEAADNGVQNLRQFFDEAFEFIDRARRERCAVLIHCHAGISRSPTIAVAYLMKHYPMAMAEAYKFVKMRRSIISPNLNFMGQLWEFEQALRANRLAEETEKAVEASSDLMKEALSMKSSDSSESIKAFLIGERCHQHLTTTTSSTISTTMTTTTSMTTTSSSGTSGLCGKTSPFQWSEGVSSYHHHPHLHLQRAEDSAITSGGVF